LFRLKSALCIVCINDFFDMTDEEKQRSPDGLIEAVQARQFKRFERALKMQFANRESKAQFEKRKAVNKSEAKGLCDVIEAIEKHWKNEIASLLK